MKSIDNINIKEFLKFKKQKNSDFLLFSSNENNTNENKKSENYFEENENNTKNNDNKKSENYFEEKKTNNDSKDKKDDFVDKKTEDYAKNNKRPIEEKSSNKSSKKDDHKKTPSSSKKHSKPTTSTQKRKRRNIWIWVLVVMLIVLTFVLIFGNDYTYTIAKDDYEEFHNEYGLFEDDSIDSIEYTLDDDAINYSDGVNNGPVYAPYVYTGIRYDYGDYQLLVFDKHSSEFERVITIQIYFSTDEDLYGWWLNNDGYDDDAHPIVADPDGKFYDPAGLGTSAPDTIHWFWIMMLQWLPWLFFFVIAIIIIRKIFQKNQGGMNFGKTKVKPEVSNLLFTDIAGYDEIKEELDELVDYLKQPKKYERAGARAPKGVLLTGPPGTGKTLFAKAVAGEAKIPFYSISGSDFVEMFVGVGAARVRDIFKSAKEHAPAIIFIDELDAVGRERGAGVGGGNDEREQTLNALLVEMDGFRQNLGIIVLSATNRPDVLDPALKRPGRFDRELQFRLPDVRERAAILKVHARKKKIASDVSLEDIALRTPGFSGAQLENVLNEAAILSVREKLLEITYKIIDEAIDRVLAGPAKTNSVITPDEKQIIAHHEAGHAVIGLKLEDAQIVQKVTIIPRGDAGGYVLMTPKKEKTLISKAELNAKISSYLAGRISEEIFFGEENITTGAYSDIQEATNIARRMVTEFGMSSLGPIQYDSRKGSIFLGRELGSDKQYSDAIALEIDKEIRKIINESWKKAKEILHKEKKLIILIAEALIKFETITALEIKWIEKNMKVPGEHISAKKIKQKLEENPELKKKLLKNKNKLKEIL